MLPGPRNRIRSPLAGEQLPHIPTAVERRSRCRWRRPVQRCGVWDPIRLRGHDVRVLSPRDHRALNPRRGVCGAAPWRGPHRRTREPRVARWPRARGAPPPAEPTLAGIAAPPERCGDPRHLREWASQPGRGTATPERRVRDDRQRPRWNRRLATCRAADRPLTPRQGVVSVRPTRCGAFRLTWIPGRVPRGAAAQAGGGTATASGRPHARLTRPSLRRHRGGGRRCRGSAWCHWPPCAG